MSNSTTFLRVEKTKNYTVILNSLITSTDLSPEEKVILFHILSLPDDWVIYKDYFKKYYRGCISDSKIDKVWKGLKAKGFLTSTRVKSENGTFSSWKYEVREVPFTDIPESDMSENQTIGNTTSQENGDIQSTNLPSTNLQSTNSTNFNNTSIILGKNEIEINNAQKEESIQTKMQRSVNLEAINRLFENTSINWVEEINILSIEDFSSKYQNITGNNNPQWLINLASNYKILNPSVC